MAIIQAQLTAISLLELEGTSKGFLAPRVALNDVNSVDPVTDGIITIKVQNHPGETLVVSIIDMNGKTLFAGKNKLDEALQSSFVIDKLGNLAQGLYIVSISGASEIFNKKIVIY